MKRATETAEHLPIADPSRRDRGASYIELLVAIVLLGTVVVGVLAAVRATVIGTRVERDHSKAQQWLQSAVGVIEAQDFASCDPLVINGANAAAYEREFAGELVASIKDLESDPLGLVFRKGDENVAAFNEGLKAIKDDGTLDQLMAKYWGAATQ